MATINLRIHWNILHGFSESSKRITEVSCVIVKWTNKDYCQQSHLHFMNKGSEFIFQSLFNAHACTYTSWSSLNVYFEMFIWLSYLVVQGIKRIVINISVNKTDHVHYRNFLQRLNLTRFNFTYEWLIISMRDKTTSNLPPNPFHRHHLARVYILFLNFCKTFH